MAKAATEGDRLKEITEMLLYKDSIVNADWFPIAESYCILYYTSVLQK